MKSKTIGVLLATLAVFAGSAFGFSTSQPVTATPISTLPYVINTSGNYYLTQNLTTNASAGAAITVNADQVVIDLNGRSLVDSQTSDFAYGILINGHEDCLVQNGDVDGFYIGVFFAPGASDQNFKNSCERVKFNHNGIGVFSLSGSSNEVDRCVVDFGDIGILFDQDAGSVARDDLFEHQVASEEFQQGLAIISIGSQGCFVENCNVFKGTNPVGMYLSGTDKYRFVSFAGFPGNGPHVGGIEEGAGDL